MSDLPRVSAYRDDIPAVCSKLGCGSTFFRTDHGEGQVFWFGGMGPEMLQFGRADNGPRIMTGTVDCLGCKTVHGRTAKLPDTPSRNIGG
jgi:hypothetical protein